MILKSEAWFFWGCDETNFYDELLDLAIVGCGGGVVLSHKTTMLLCGRQMLCLVEE